jgi:HNH endonuclease
MDAVASFKRCSRCLTDKPLAEFYRDKSRRDGRSARCKMCHALPPVHQTLEQRFWSKVHKTDTCWIWIAAKWPNGYGHFVLPTHHALAHRVAWELTHGPIPEGMYVLHNCPGQDNKACVNPQHLWLGTHQDNATDAIAKGQILRGTALTIIRQRSMSNKERHDKYS